mgnify:CR=1 FL=1
MSASAYGTFGPHLHRLYRHTHVNGALVVTERQFYALLEGVRPGTVEVSLPEGRRVERRAITGKMVRQHI